MKFKYSLCLLASVLALSMPAAAQAQTAGKKLERVSAIVIPQALKIVPNRMGELPSTPNGIPHQQRNQNAPVTMQQALTEAVANLPGVYLEQTPFSLSGSIGWRLTKEMANGSSDAFIQNSPEFGHQHIPSDGSMHLLLPNDYAAELLKKGWGVIHPFTNSISGDTSQYVMIFGPRDEVELSTIWLIVQASYYYARGSGMD